MELMATCLEKLLKKIQPDTIPEKILGKVVVAVSALVNSLN